jgi:hypothetical protein
MKTNLEKITTIDEFRLWMSENKTTYRNLFIRRGKTVYPKYSKLFDEVCLELERILELDVSFVVKVRTPTNEIKQQTTTMTLRKALVYPLYNDVLKRTGPHMY